jgi:outer membrane protein OmpA-like peptidoglycan-associated protein
MAMFVTPPSSNGGSNVEEWEFTAYPGAITTSMILVPNTLQNWEALGLRPGTTYSFTIRFRNAAGWSAESPRSISISTLAELNPPPAPAPSQPQPTINEPPPAVVRVPLPIRLLVECVPEGQQAAATLNGENLDSITSASVDGKTIGISNVTSGSLDLALPALSAGTYDISFNSIYGLVVHQSALRVCRSATVSPTISATVSPTISQTLSPSISPTTSSSTSPSNPPRGNPTSPPEPPASKPIKDEAEVFFAANSAILSAAARRELAALAQKHLDMKSSYIVVEGFALSVNDPSYARSLANRRALATVRFLRSLGLNVFYKVAATAPSSGSSAQSRRVEVSVTSRR